MFLLDSLLIGGIKFVLDKVATVVDQEMDSPATLHQHLLEAQMDLEEGKIDQAAFDVIERDVLARIRELKANDQTGGIADASAFGEVEIDYPDDER